MTGFGDAWATDRLGRGTLIALCLVTALALAIALLPLKWVALSMLGGAALVVTLIQPRLGVLLLIPAVPFGSLLQVPLGIMNVGLTELLFCLVLMAWLMQRISVQRGSLIWPCLSLPLLLFLAAQLLSLVAASSLEHGLKEMAKWVEVLILYLIVSGEADSQWKRWLVLTCLGSGALAALHGIYQFLFQTGPEGFVLFGRFMRAYGTFEQPNPYGGYLGLVLPLAVGILLANLVGKKARPGLGLIVCALISGALMLAALVMSWSRGAWLGFATALTVMLAAALIRSRRGALAACILVLGVGYGALTGGFTRLPPAIVERFGDIIPYLGLEEVRGVEITDANFAVLERMAHWQAAAAMWTDHPWLGVGAGNYEPVYPTYALPLWPLPLGHAHNYYLNIAAEAGVLGLAAYIVLWGAALAFAWRAAAHRVGWQQGFALGVLGVVTHLTIHNVFDNLFVHGMYLHVAILLGALTPHAPD